MKKSSYTIYTDGGCEELYLGGYGAVIIDNNSGEQLVLWGGDQATTNNRMEITAVLVALSRVEQRAVVELYADSQYVLNTIDGKYSKNKNKDLWDKLDKVMKGKTIITHWVKGHSGNYYNELCDSLCKKGMENPDGITREEKRKSLKPSKKDRKRNKTSKKDIKKTVGTIKGTPSKTISTNPKGMYLIKSGTSMETLYTIPTEYLVYKGPKRQLNDVGKRSVRYINETPFPSFKDFKNMKTGGVDAWSDVKNIKDAYIIASDEVVDIVKEIIGEDDPNNVMSVLRWYARGVTLDKAIRKVLVDMEINKNYLESLKKKK